MFWERTRDLLADSFGRAFAQTRSQQRAMELGLGALCSFGRRTLSRSIGAVGRQFQDWSADYKLFSRSPWEAEDLFDPVLEEYVARYPQGPVRGALDSGAVRGVSGGEETGEASRRRAMASISASPKGP